MAFCHANILPCFPAKISINPLNKVLEHDSKLNLLLLTIFLFLVADTHLYKRLCPSVRPLVRSSVWPSVRPSISTSQKVGKLAYPPLPTRPQLVAMYPALFWMSLVRLLIRAFNLWPIGLTQTFWAHATRLYTPLCPSICRSVSQSDIFLFFDLTAPAQMVKWPQIWPLPTRTRPG